MTPRHWIQNLAALRFLGVAALLVIAPRPQADVRLHSLFTDHGVLQQHARVPVWGWADEGEKVTVEFAGQTVSTVARQGRWSVQLAPMGASDEPRTLRVAGRNTLEVRDVLVGEVWIASGQSNMEWPMHRSEAPEADIAGSAHPRIRLFTVPKRRESQPVSNVNAQWAECGPEAVRNFSAVAYYFGRDLQGALNVPVGLIHTSWGGSPAEVWVRDEMLKSDPAFRRDILDPYVVTFRNYMNARLAWERERDAAKAAGQTFNKPGPNPGWRPSELYNGMIAPLLPYAIRGAIWYQGESNASRAAQYRRLFPAMIQNWRQDWGQPDFPFLAVQLAPWDRNKKRSLEEITAQPVESDWAELREAQNLAATTLKNVGVAVITDVGDKDDIHPAKKAPVGARLALLARQIAYRDQKLLARGPVFKNASFSGGKARLIFEQVGTGLASGGSAPTGFAIAGEDRKFHWAEARIEGRQAVVLHSPNVPKPVAVRYGWADFPVVNLSNSAGLPASPFRTDRWPVSTEVVR